MMKSAPPQSLPNPASLPIKPRRQGPKVRAFILAITIGSFFLFKHHGENMRKQALGLAETWIPLRPSLAPVEASQAAEEPLMWRDPSIPVDKSEDHLPDNFRPLGPDADARYELRSSDFDRYMTSILRSASTLFSPSMAREIADALLGHYPNASSAIDPAAGYADRSTEVLSGPHMKTIWQTDKSHGTWRKELMDWDGQHKEIGWSIERLNDAEANAWVRHHFEGTDIEWTWRFMTRPILKADFLRYLFMLVHGGFYADVDTSPIRPVTEWGILDPVVIDISRTDGPNWRAKMAEKPSVVVGLEVNPIAWETWATWIARPISFVQFAFGSTAHHPIFLDVVDSIVQTTKVVDERERWLENDMKWRETSEDKSFIEQIKAETKRPDVLAWTGPVLFTDAIVSWLTARYKISWQRLRGYDRPIRIGDLLVLPHGALDARLMRDSSSDNGFLPQAQMEHFLHGDTEDGWKHEGP